jgi:hypothetical protein
MTRTIQLLAAVFLFSIGGVAQDTAILVGSVTDATGAVIPGASPKFISTK